MFFFFVCVFDVDVDMFDIARIFFMCVTRLGSAGSLLPFALEGT